VIYRSPYPDVPIPSVSLPDLVLERARERGSHAALIDGVSGAVTTYAELADAVERVAAGLDGLGFRRGDVAAICAPNCVELPIALLAVTRLGGAVTTMNPAFTPAEMGKQLSDAGAVLAFTTSELAARVREAAGSRLRHVLCFDDDSFAVLARTAGGPPAVAVDPAEDVAVLPYSSGTTGAPKGVMLTHRNLVAMLLAMHPVEGTTDRDVTIAALPFFHIYGLSVILCLGLYRGATLVVLPRFQMEQFLAAVERWRVTRLPLVPPLALRLAREPLVDRFDLSSVRVAVSGAAPLPPEVARALSERLGCLVKQGYGLTELSPGSHMHPEDAGTPPPGSVGVLHPNTECRLVDPVTLLDVAAGERGEIWVRGPQVMKGYLKRPEATAEMITPDGWLRTGDIGTIDGEGYLYVVDRLKELVKYKGFQVAPAELEALLLTHPAVTDVAVIPKPDAEAGEIPKAFVVVGPDATVTADELMAFVAERVANYKRVREVELVAEIPKSPSGKILRRVLVERERSRAHGGLSDP
jgi:acyl-CoA synthetase (AMP-forming)/AMP-acid ligase II